jgi:hypothetical protein
VLSPSSTLPPSLLIALPFAQGKKVGAFQKYIISISLPFFLALLKVRKFGNAQQVSERETRCIMIRGESGLKWFIKILQYLKF